MSSHFCLSCCFPVYRVNSNRGREVYACLTEDCRNFKVSVPKFETFVDCRHQMLGESNYSAQPLEDESQLGVAWPHTEQHTHGEYGYPAYLPEAGFLFPPPENQLLVAQPCPPQSTQQEPVAVPQLGTTSLSEDPTSSKTRCKKNASAEKKNLILEKPWSELPIAEGSDPRAEIEKYVNRSLERRHLEAESDGKVKRCLNAFVLYRKAYSGVAKAAGLQSFPAKAAEIWASESASVRDQFYALANTERLLHKQAFPDYKYVFRGMNKKKGKKD